MRLIEPRGSLTARASDDLAELRLDDQVAIVTGGAQGMGLAVAVRLGARGAKVAVIDRNGEAVVAALESLREAGVEAVGVEADVTSSDDTSAVSAAIGERWGRVDILVNCAGVAGGNAPVAELDDEAWERVLAVNLTGTFRMSRAVVPMMLERGYGRIVNVASMAGKDGNPNAAHYSASKAGVIAFTKSLGKELATSGVLVNVIVPAVIKTPMVHDVTPAQLEFMLSKIPMGRMGQPLEVARLVAFLASPHLSYSTGAAYDISGGRATY